MIIDSVFDLSEIGLTSIDDLPFNGFFVRVIVTATPPSLIGTLIDDAFDLAEVNLTSIEDLPLNGFFIREAAASIQVVVFDTVNIIESANVELNPLQINVFDVTAPLEAVTVQFFPPAAAEEALHGGTDSRSLPTRVREAQRIQQLIKLRRLLDDEDMLFLME